MTLVAHRTVLITGAASGIGRRMAHELAARSARIAAWDIDRTGLDKLLSELPGEGHYADKVDVSDPDQVREAAARVHNEAGPVHVLVNNAGVVSGKKLLEVDEDRIRKTFGVNTLALFWTTRAFLPGMIERNEGHVVTVASAAGLVGVKGLVDYSSSKFAAVGFDEALRMELADTAPGVKTTVVCPFFIDTGMFEGAKTRFAWLLPILKEQHVARSIVRAIEKGHKRVVLPGTVHLIPPSRLLPVHLFDRLASFLGVNAAMDHFKGRVKREATGPLTDVSAARGNGASPEAH